MLSLPLPLRQPSMRRTRATRRRCSIEGRKTFRYETFGSEAFWGDTLQLHKAIAGEKNGGVGPGVSPKTALSVGLKVDADALPDALKQQIKAGKVNLDDPATTIALLKLNAVVGVTAFANPDGSVKSMGIQCAFCHSTVDNSFAPGIGKRLDGWANRDLNVGAIVSLAPNLKPFTDLLGVDVETVKKVLASWGPGRYDAELDKDGKAFRPDGKQAGTLIPPAFGLAGVNLATWTGFGSVTYWNAYVAGTQMHGAATFFDARFNNKDQYPVSAKSGSGNTRNTPDKTTAKLAALHFYQLSIPAPKAPAGSYDKAAFERGKTVFNGSGKCATCHVPPLYTEPGYNMHAPERDRRRRVPGRPFADPHVPHGTSRGAVDASEGRLLPRRALRHLARRGEPLRYAIQPEPQRRKQKGSGRVSKGDISILERRRRRWLKKRLSRPVPICPRAFPSISLPMAKCSSVMLAEKTSCWCGGGTTFSRSGRIARTIMVRLSTVSWSATRCGAHGITPVSICARERPSKRQP